MSIVSVGSNGKYSDNWDSVFGGKTGKTRSTKKTVSATKKAKKPRKASPKKAARKKK